MAYLKVNYKSIENSCGEIDNYVSEMKSKMSKMNKETGILAGSWQGVDFNAFQAKWNNVSNSDSTYSIMLNTLKSYSSYLKYVSSTYKSVQSKAKNRASKLPRW